MQERVRVLPPLVKQGARAACEPRLEWYARASERVGEHCGPAGRSVLTRLSSGIDGLWVRMPPLRRYSTLAALCILCRPIFANIGAGRPIIASARCLSATCQYSDESSDGVTPGRSWGTPGGRRPTGSYRQDLRAANATPQVLGCLGAPRSCRVPGSITMRDFSEFVACGFGMVSFATAYTATQLGSTGCTSAVSAPGTCKCVAELSSVLRAMRCVLSRRAAKSAHLR